MSEMYKYDYLVDRVLQNSPCWIELLNMCELDERGANQQGLGFENDTFVIRPYNWNDENDSLPNFEYKPSGFRIEWYKYPFRASYMNIDWSVEYIELIFCTCKCSLFASVADIEKEFGLLNKTSVGRQYAKD